MDICGFLLLCDSHWWSSKAISILTHVSTAYIHIYPHMWESRSHKWGPHHTNVGVTFVGWAYWWAHEIMWIYVDVYMWMYVHIRGYAWIYVDISTDIHIHPHTSTYIHIYPHIYGYMWIYVDICGYLWMYVDICGYMWIYVDICGYMWIYVDICGYMWIYVDVCGCMWMYVDICGYMWIYVDICGYMWIYVDICRYLCVKWELQSIAIRLYIAPLGGNATPTSMCPSSSSFRALLMGGVNAGSRAASINRLLEIIGLFCKRAV